MKCAVMTIAAFLVFIIASCGKEPAGPAPYAVVNGTVAAGADSTVITHANVMVYNAETNSPVTRLFTGPDGLFSVNINAGIYYLKITAQGFSASPPQNGSPLPFEVAAGDTLVRSFYLDPDPASAGSGSISGTVTYDGDGIAGVLVVAVEENGTRGYSGTTGPDGFFIIYNVQPGDYSFEFYRSGYLQTGDAVTATVKAGSSVAGADGVLSAFAGARLEGNVTFIATSNSIVDITLVHPLTREAIPGLQTFNEGSNSYRLDAVPPGTYIAWASYMNDNYVMDPDRIAKFGLPRITIGESDTVRQLDFDVTGAVVISTPTNDPDTIRPVLITSNTPTFTWTKTSAYSSAKEFIVEVFDSRGNTVWGGFDSSGTVRHTQIPSSQTSVVFNFDGSATDTLAEGGTYRWKVYADNDDALNVQTLLSASEDLLGLFTVVTDTTR